MKKMLVVSAMLFAASFGAQAQSGGEFKVGADPDYRPMAWTNEKGQAVGYDVDFAGALAERLKLKLVHQGMAWDGIIPALQAKKIDAITSIVITDKRKEQVAFSQPVLDQQIIVVVPANYNGPAPNAEQLKSMKVGVQINTAAGNVLNQLKIPATTYNSMIDEFNDLALGRVQAVAVESIGGSYTVASAFAGKLKVAPGVTLSASPQYIAVALRKDDKDFQAQVDGAITAMKKDGKLQEITKKWFGDADVIAK
jgi:ABC-type amino acid transport substrate-binding protein